MHLPGAAVGLGGFCTGAPTGTKFGLPFKWACRLAMAMLTAGCWGTAVFLVTLFNGYLHPSESAAMLVEDLPPIHHSKEQSGLAQMAAPKSWTPGTWTSPIA